MTFSQTHTFGSGGDVSAAADKSTDTNTCSRELTARDGANDFSAGTLISAPACWIEGSNTGADTETSEPNHAGNSGGASVWWTWVSPVTGTAEFDTVGSGFDTLLAVYSGETDITSIEEEVANDDIERDTIYQSAVEFDAEEGERYYVVVDGHDGATGDIRLNWRVEEAVQVQDLPDAQPLQDFNVMIPASCPRQVEICVRDWACEDGDEVTISVNGAQVLRTELFNAPRCVDVPVREGVNTISLLALNDSGYKCGGNCGIFCTPGDVDFFALINSGEVTISGSQQAQRWRHRGGAGSRANLNVTVGGSGSCP